MIRHNELWGGVFSSPFIKGGPVYPLLKEVLMLLSLVFGEYEQLLLTMTATEILPGVKVIRLFQIMEED